jgi:hypothetical protein
MSVDPLFNQVELLLNFETSAIKDSSTNDLTLTSNGTGLDRTNDVPLFDSYALYLPSCSSPLTSPHLRCSNFPSPGNQDFTLETWVRFTSAVNGFSIVNAQYNSSYTSETDTNRFELYILNNDPYFKTNGTVRAGKADLATNTWHHIAVVRSSGQLRIFVNGDYDGDTYADTTIYNATLYATIGNENITTTTFTHYLEDFRLTVGAARYWANFTPPTEPFPTQIGALGSFTGTVYERNPSTGVFVPGAYPVRVYRQDTGVLVASTTSAVDGSYTIADLPAQEGEALTDVEYYLVATDVTDPYQTPAIVAKVIPS